MIFADSAAAHHFLDGLNGIEIGGAAHNPFNIPGCRNVDFSDDMSTVFKEEERRQAGLALAVDVVANGDNLPFSDESLEYVLHSHVFEHFWDPIAAIEEWLRVLVPGGIVFMIVPHKERTFDHAKSRTTLAELIGRHDGRLTMPPGADPTGHHSIWITQDVVELLTYLGHEILAVADTDDKVGNGFTIVFRKPGELTSRAQTLDLGCGTKKRPGAIGIDKQALPGVDVVIDVAHTALPFADSSVANVCSNDLFGYLDEPAQLLREIVRVCRPGATVNISTPHGASDAAMAPGTRARFVESTWVELLGSVAAECAGGTLTLNGIDLFVAPTALTALAAHNVPLDFALAHCTNVVTRITAVMTVRKPKVAAPANYTRRVRKESGQPRR